MTQPWQEVLRNLRQQHPKAHHYTLALLLQVQTGRIISGDAVKTFFKQPQC